MKLRIALLALAALVTKSTAGTLERRQWGGFGGGGFGGGKSINDYKREQVAGRDIHVYAPANLAPQSPLLLSLHGMDQDPNYQQQNTHWETLADSEGFVVVYPRGGTGMSTWDISGTKDTNWVLQIIDQMAKEYDIDTKRVYLSGFSMGGMFTYNAMSKIADRIAAFAPCSGPNVMGATRAQRPVPIIHVHGTNDDVLPYAQVEGYLKNYRDQFNCPAQAQTQTNYPNSENPNATMYTWGPCDGGVYIKHLKLQGRGHSPSAADIGDIWNFVKEYSLDSVPETSIPAGGDAGMGGGFDMGGFGGGMGGFGGGMPGGFDMGGGMGGFGGGMPGGFDMGGFGGGMPGGFDMGGGMGGFGGGMPGGFDMGGGMGGFGGGMPGGFDMGGMGGFGGGMPGGFDMGGMGGFGGGMPGGGMGGWGGQGGFDMGGFGGGMGGWGGQGGFDMGGFGGNMGGFGGGMGGWGGF